MRRSRFNRWIITLFVPVTAFISLYILQGLMSEQEPISFVSAQSTALIQNGEFDSSLVNWDYQSGTVLWVDLGGSYGGVAKVTKGYQITQTNIILTDTQPGIYELSFDCVSTSGRYWAYFDYTLATSNSDVPPLVANAYCPKYGGWLHHVVNLTLMPGETYTLSFKAGGQAVYLDNAALVNTHSLEDIDTGIINNGDFVGASGWDYTASAYYVPNVGITNTQLGATKIGTGYRITQTNITLTDTQPGIYEFSFDCVSTSWGYLDYKLVASSSNAPLLTANANCPKSGTGWLHHVVDLTLIPGEVYTLSFKAGGQWVYLDSVVLVKTSNLEDIDTGIIDNGDFIGASGWDYAYGSLYDPTKGFTNTQLGAVRVPNGSQLTQTNPITVPEYLPGNYQFSFNCLGGGSWGWVHFILGSVVETVTCPASSSGWITYTKDLLLVPGETLVLRFNGSNLSNNTVYLDNISLVSPYAQGLLPDRMVWNASPECPFCGTTNAIGWAGNAINTRNGNLSYQETDLSIPVAGGSLDFHRSYASDSTDFYTSTLGFGWTHNFDMRLHFSNTALPDTVELQAPGGSRLPFFDNGDGTFSPYYGVTAQLSQVGSTYVVTGFNQMVYTFNNLGLLTQQEGPAGNIITFSYNANDQLISASQGVRSLSYTYDDSNRLISVTDNENRTIELGYDDNGDLSVVTNTLGLASTYTYSGTTHLLTKVIDPSGRIIKETAYDNQGRAYQQRDGAGNLLVDIVYNDTENIHVVTENGVVMTHTYDARNTLVDVTYTCTDGTTGCLTGNDISYDRNFKQSAILDANGNPTSLSWNDAGCNLESVTDALDNQTMLSYDALNNLTQTINAIGQATTYYYDNATYPTFRTRMVDAKGKTTYYTPTVASVDGVVGGLLKEELDANSNLTTYAYNDFGQVIETVQAAGTNEAITTHYGYDDVGRLITTTQESTTESHTSLNVYNAGDWLIATINNWTGNDPTNWASDCDTSTGPRDSNVCTRYGYDDAGRTISTTNSLGQTNLTFYNDAGRTYLTVTNYDGAAYNPANPEATLCNFSNPDPEYNLCAKTEYDSFGRVVTTTNSLGQQNVTEYDSLGRVNRNITNWVDGVFNPSEPDQDIETLYEYDAAGNTIIATDTLGNMTRTFYDPLNRVVGTIENWSGSITSLEDLPTCLALPTERDEDVCTLYEYDEVGNTIIVTDTVSRMTRTFYDDLNRVEATVTNWNPATLTSPADCVLSPTNENEENICTLYGYDTVGNQITTTNALNQTSLTVYDAANRPVVQVANWDGTVAIDATGNGCADTTANPQAIANLCTITIYDSLGRRSSTQDAMGAVTQFAYDGLGRVITTTRYLDNTPITSVTTYDALGNRLSQTDAEGHTTTFTYDSLNRLKTTTSAAGVVVSQAYNAAGWVITTTDGLGPETVVDYDELGRQISVTDAENNTTTYEYDALGNQVAMIDAESVRTTYLYDDLNRLIGVVENDVPGDNPTHKSDVLTQYVYDVLGNRVVITNALSYTGTLTTYDVLNRPIIVEDALGNKTYTEYNALGYRTVMTDANGEVTTYSYDALNRLEDVNYLADGETVSYEYDAVGNRLVMTDSLGVTSYNYDDLYRLTSVTDPFTGTVGYDYDLVGNRSGLTHPDGKVITNTYDADNRLTQVEDWDNGITTYEYDLTGRLITTTLPNNVVTVNTYDKAGRLTNLTHSNASGDDLAHYVYELDGVGNRVVTTETLQLPGSAITETTITAYDYDPLYRLTEAVYTGAITATYRYGYDGVGNMTMYTDTVGTQTIALVRTFDAANRLKTSGTSGSVDQEFTYDNNGNLTTIHNTLLSMSNNYIYNQRNLLTRVNFGSQIGIPGYEAYVYDGDGNRLQKIYQESYFSDPPPPITTTYTNDIVGLSQVLVASDGITTTHNLFGLDLIHQDDGTTTRTLLADGLGSVRTEMVAGAVETVMTYEPYGNLLVQTGTSDTTYGFTGEQHDAATGLLYLRARYYNPAIQLFMSRDAWIGDMYQPMSYNPWLYVYANPINYTDPTGLRPIDEDSSGQHASSDLFSSYIVIRRESTHPGLYYLQVNYQQHPWGRYKNRRTPSYPVMIPVRHPLDLTGGDSNCILSLEIVKAIYASGAFMTWEVNARNIMQEVSGVILAQKEWALRDAIGIAYVPYNRVDFNNLPRGERYPPQGGTFFPYDDRDDALGMLLAGDGQFAVLSTAGYKAAFKGLYADALNVYHFSLAVTYGVHYRYLRDTSYGATGYFHRPYDPKDDRQTPDFGHCQVTGEYYDYTFFRNQRYENYDWRDRLFTSAELEQQGGWPDWASDDKWHGSDWITGYPPAGCDY